jgi:Uma2 family endonuclease
MDTSTLQVGTALEEFIRQYGKQPFEFIQHKRIQLMPQIAGHGEIVQLIEISLDEYASAHGLGEAWMRMPFVQLDDSGNVAYSFTPDVIYFTAQRAANYRAEIPDWKNKPYILVPDLVVEVVSPDDNLGELGEKVDLYLTDGVQLVWVMDFNKETVSIHTLISLQPFTKQQTTLKVGDTLTGGEIIPGFEIPVATLFE